jgi:hypothetical protein
MYSYPYSADNLVKSEKGPNRGFSPFWEIKLASRGGLLSAKMGRNVLQRRLRPFLLPLFTNVLEGEFCELLLYRILRSSA